jgi:hypothetical protein
MVCRKGHRSPDNGSPRSMKMPSGNAVTSAVNSASVRSTSSNPSGFVQPRRHAGLSIATARQRALADRIGAPPASDPVSDAGEYARLSAAVTERRRWRCLPHLRDGQAITGAGGSSRIPVVADYAHKVACRAGSPELTNDQDEPKQRGKEIMLAADDGPRPGRAQGHGPAEAVEGSLGTRWITGIAGAPS